MPTMNASEGGHRIYKCAFVTVGASASFKPLIEEVLSDAFIAKLKSLGFTHLIVQCGPDYDYFESAKPRRDSNDSNGLNITGFPFKKDLQPWFALAAASTLRETKERAKGLIITHAGSGSILDALDFDTNIIAVPNPALMGNHQSEIADEMEKQGFLTQAKVGSLADLLSEDALAATKKQWPPEPDPDSVWPGGLWDVVNYLMPRRTLGGGPADDENLKVPAK
ncbi:glycosyltransferase family 1 protein [Jackrogersella minutella]|nr:glycosyltransferase family 1 protein [Jackrogersella minutella]